MKNFIGIISVLTCLTTGFCSEPIQNEVMIAADHLEFDGEKVTLIGHAEVTHELGAFVADLMTLDSKAKKKGVLFDFLQMDGHVDIALAKSGRLFCSKAIIDQEALTGIFLSSPEQERVIYNAISLEKKEGGAPLMIESSTMQIQLSKEEENPRKIDIHSITAEGDVLMNYNGFNVTSDHAFFKRNIEDKITKHQSLSGKITLSCHSQERCCHLTNEQKDEILSKEIFVDTIQRELIFSYPEGSFTSLAAKGLNFSAKKLVWNEQSSRIILSEDVEIIQQGFGKLQAANDVLVVLTTINGKKIPRGMETHGPIVLTYMDSESGFDHVLKSYGSFRIDHQKMETRLQSPENDKGRVIEGKQVFFQDAKGEIYADKAFVKYDYLDQKIVPVRIVLQGNVKILNSLAKSNEDKIPINQYILAERVDFIPQTKEMIFKASKGKRVLLFDHTNNLEVSAPGLKLIRDKAARKETIQGIGDVRFSFVEKELDQLRRQFSFDNIKK